MEDRIGELLNGPGYFYCEKEHCTLRFEICLARQKLNQERSAFMPVSFVSCDGCRQGIKNQLLEIEGARVKNPTKGRGERDLACEFYDECLDLAAKEEWEGFTCTSCELFSQGLEDMPAIEPKDKDMRLCRECGEKPTIQPSSPLCASCIGKQAWKDRSKNKGSGETKKIKSTQDKAQAEKPQQALNMALTIQFQKYPSILKEIEKLADSQIRTVEEQIIYVLKSFVGEQNLSNR